MSRRPLRKAAAIATSTVLACAGLLAGAGAAQAAPSDIVSFADPALQACFNKELSQSASTPITEAQIENVLKVWCGAATGNVSSLEGIEYATKLGQVKLYAGNTVTDLSPLSDLPRLQTLDVLGGPVTDLKPVAKIASLDSLVLAGSAVTDLSPLAGMPNLTNVNVSETAVSDLSPLAQVPTLRTLDASDSNVSDLSPLSELENLYYLSARAANVSDLTPLAGVVSLEHLNVGENSISDVTPLAGLMNLRSLLAHKNHIVNISSLTDLPALQSLMANDQKVTADEAYVGFSETNPITSLNGVIVPVKENEHCANDACTELIYNIVGEDVAVTWLTTDSIPNVGGGFGTFSGTLVRDVVAAPTAPPVIVPPTTVPPTTEPPTTVPPTTEPPTTTVPAVSPDTDGKPVTATGAKHLAETGADAGVIGIAAAVLLALGGAATFLSMRRARQQA